MLQEATGAPTLGGAYATLALNVGAAGGPVAGGAMLTASGDTVGSVVISAALAAIALPVVGLLLRLTRKAR
nr:hypothetical protein [Microlunatus soli]